MGKEKTITFSGDEVDVNWNGQLCIHIGECGRAKGDLFVGGRKPWCQPDLVSKDEVEEIVLRCPTGALTYKHKDKSKQEVAVKENSIHVSYNGPLYFNGDLDIEGAPDDTPGLAFRAALCRCGKSTNKPFCDNSHEEDNFKDYGAIGISGEGLEGTGGKLSINPVPDGPLIIKGNVSIMSGSGRKAWEGNQVALCRCGASENKPFCDGKHKNVEFKT